jgi:CheY-like chemotaxis protein
MESRGLEIARPPEETCCALIVTESTVLRELISGFIMQSDLQIGQVFCAPNRKEAVEICRRIQVDVLVADQHLEFRRGEGPVASIIVGPPSAEKIQESLERGAAGYLVKPFSKESLVQEVRRALARETAAGQAVQAG